jgi:phage terminase Nu1 subunit (DNA packaging protein)
MDVTRLTQQQAAALASVTSRTLRDWADAPRNVDGTYNGPKFVRWLIDRANPESDEYDSQRERLAAAQAEKVEAENAVRRGFLADVRRVLAAWAELVAAFRAKVLAIPTKLAPQLTNVSDPKVIAGRIRAELYAALAELAAGDWIGEPDDTATADGSDSRPAAGPGRQRVGRRKAQAE